MSHRILIVEDDSTLGDMFCRTLEAQGYEVELACDGKSGLASLMSNPPDLVLLDMHLPFMSGYDIIQKIRQTEATKDVRIIAATASTVAQTIPVVQDADLLLMKPISLMELDTMVTRLLHQDLQKNTPQAANQASPETEDDAETENVSQNVAQGMSQNVAQDDPTSPSSTSTPGM
ncbi:response regulator [Phototrophicus methaneseepsis]|uniref:Response regulator n=1 Tax=Phototrophicus methaneseepsis TaxID=2710758 RepID=A0A7S8IDF8_9CHLR|nr:response regulator [Phototrophicus methaneseepsis]QPC82545.1 response regulator [Phototrophicus methaneseepsis]